MPRDEYQYPPLPRSSRCSRRPKLGPCDNMFTSFYTKPCRATGNLGCWVSNHSTAAAAPAAGTSLDWWWVLLNYKFRSRLEGGSFIQVYPLQCLYKSSSNRSESARRQV